MQEYRYVVVSAGNAVNEFVENDPLGQFMFNGDEFWAGGRVLNCKAVAAQPTRSDGYVLAQSFFVLLAPMAGNEYNEIINKGFDVIDDFDNYIAFLQKYTAC